jgi:hypothetical protein
MLKAQAFDAYGKHQVYQRLTSQLADPLSVATIK